MPVPILGYIRAAMRNVGISSNAQMAKVMNSYEDRSREWTKESVDKIFQNDQSCPMAATLAELKRAAQIPDFDPVFYRIKKGVNDDE